MNDQSRAAQSLQLLKSFSRIKDPVAHEIIVQVAQAAANGASIKARREHDDFEQADRPPTKPN